MESLLRCAQACGVTSLAYEGLEVSFQPLKATVPAYPADDGEYVVSREGPEAPKAAKVVRSEVSEVVNLVADYDRWDHFEAPPTEDDG